MVAAMAANEPAAETSSGPTKTIVYEGTTDGQRWDLHVPHGEDTFILKAGEEYTVPVAVAEQLQADVNAHLKIKVS